MIDVKSEHLEIVTKILKKHLHKQQVIAFGSRVNNTAKPFSDLDLCVIGNQPLSLKLLVELREAFSESDLSFRVDIVDWANISQGFKTIIMKNSIKIDF